MSSKRYYYSDTISDFMEKEEFEIVGELTLAYSHTINDETKRSWLDEIRVLRSVLNKYRNRGSVYFEYNIPRMGRRADVIALIDDIVFVIEFKTINSKFTHEAVIQVWDYALDLKNFQEGSRNRKMVPILVAPTEKDKNCVMELSHFEDLVYRPMQVNEERLNDAIDCVLAEIGTEVVFSPSKDYAWAKSGYEPTPTIIEAAIALYEENTVEDITKHDGNIDETSKCLENIIKECRENKHKGICFVTGVPGAGKTLIGLQTAISQFEQNEKAVYLSGNFPLVEVLQEALSRDYVRRSKEKGERCTKAEAKSKVKAFIQMIHHYRDFYLEGTKVVNGKILPIEGYFQSHTDRAYIPAEHVAIFDEAQRAWTKEELVRFMKEKKSIKDFPWGLVVCLIGGGQEINKGEAGISEWIASLNRSFNDWHVYMSDKLTEKEYADGKTLELLSIDNSHVHIEPSLHLSVSMRSFRAEKVSLFVHQLLSLQKEDAALTLKELQNYPIVLTRSLDDAKQWLKSHARGSERYGILASSRAERLKAISINVRYQPDFVHWFLEDASDIRSSNALEDTLTEFKVQGLEIDWACVAWDADLRLNKNHTKWEHYQLRSGTKWQNINKPINREYQINAYRVLLTRARQGMVLVVPNGDYGVPPDETRKPEWYDGIYNYLKEIGIKEI